MSINSCHFIGNIGRDPEYAQTKSGKDVTKFSIAVTEKFGGTESTTWVDIVAWGKLACICRDYLTKGKQVYISGRLSKRSYDDRDGNKRYITEIVADQMQML